MTKVFKTHEEYQQWIEKIRERGEVDVKLAAIPIVTHDPWTDERDVFFKRILEVVLNCHDGLQEVYNIYIGL